MKYLAYFSAALVFFACESVINAQQPKLGEQYSKFLKTIQSTHVKIDTFFKPDNPSKIYSFEISRNTFEGYKGFLSISISKDGKVDSYLWTNNPKGMLGSVRRDKKATLTAISKDRYASLLKKFESKWGASQVLRKNGAVVHSWKDNKVRRDFVLDGETVRYFLGNRQMRVW